MQPSSPRPATLNTARALRIAGIVLPLGVLGNLILTLSTTDRHLLSSLADLPKAPLVVAGALSLVPWITNTLRLQLWTAFVGHPVSLLGGLRVVLASILGSAVTPTSSGGGVFKWALLTRHGLPPGAAASLLTVEVVEDTLFFLLALPLALVATTALDIPELRATFSTLGSRAVPLVLTIVILLLLLGLGASLALRGTLGRVLCRWSRRGFVRVRQAVQRSLQEAATVYRLIAQRGKTRFAFSMGLTTVQWTARYSVATAVLAFLGVPVRPVLFGLLQWATFTLMNAVPTPGAIGGAEAAFAVLYSPFVPSSILGVATAAWRLTLFYLPVSAAALVFLVTRRLPTGPPAAKTPV